MIAKKLLCQDCTHTYYVSKPLKLHCDASATGLSTCLVHDKPDKSECPVAYASHALTAPKKNYTQIEREPLAIIKSSRDRLHI